MYQENTDYKSESQDNFYDKAVSAFTEQMISDGFLFPGRIIANGLWHRFFQPGGSKNNVDSAYMLKINGEHASGCYYSYRDEERKYFFTHGKKLSFIEQYQNFEPASPTHPYLIKKQIPETGFKQSPDGRLVVPMVDQTGQCCGLQYISADGSKRYAAGSLKSGSRLDINGDESTVFLCEGLSTGLSVHLATKNKVIVSWDVGNLEAVGLWAAETHPNSRIIFAADNDSGGKRNVGVESAQKAADAVGADVVVPEMPGGGKCDWNDIHCKIGLEECRKQLELPCPISKEAYFLHVSEMLENPSSWLIKRFIERNCLAELFGASGSYKSFMAIHAGLCIASGKKFFEMPVKKPGPVLFIIGEGHSGFKRRLLAWALWHKVDLNSLPILVSRRPAELTVKESVDHIRAGIPEIQKKYGDPALIIVDTLNRNYGPGDENSTADMTRFIQGCDAIRQVCNSTVLIIHHSGNFEKERSRGSSVLGSAVDFKYRMDQNKNGSVNLVFLKCKDQSIPGPKTFRPKVVDLGAYDEDGEPITSCILEETELNTDGGQDRSGKGSKQALMKSILEQMVNERDAELVAAGEKPEGCVPVSDWLSKCSESGCNRQDRYRNKDFFNGLIIDGLIYLKMYA